MTDEDWYAKYRRRVERRKSIEDRAKEINTHNFSVMTGLTFKGAIRALVKIRENAA